MTADGERVAASDFPNDGEVWWMLVNQTRQLAKSGTLVIADMEPATPPDPSLPTASRIQATKESVRLMGPETGYSVLTLDRFTGIRLEELVGGSFKTVVAYQPTERAFVRCLGKVVGPLRVAATEHATGWQVSFQTANSDKTVISLAESEFNALVEDHNLRSFQEPVSFNSDPRRNSGNQRKVDIEILLATGYNNLIASCPETLLLESSNEKLVRAASQMGATRTKRQQLRALLDELDPRRIQTESGQDYEALIADVKRNLDDHETSLTEMTEAFLKSGLFGADRIRQAEEKFAQQYVESRRATLDSEIQMQIAQLQSTRQELEKSVLRLRQEETVQKKNANEMAQAALKNERQKLEADIRKREVRLEAETASLKSLQETIQGSLAGVAAEMKEHGDAIVTRFLSMAPLLNIVSATGVEPREIGTASESSPQPLGAAGYEFAPYLSSLSNARVDSELQFLDRFERLVQEAGLSYRSIDLRRFHISTKIGGIAILGGPSGTGKSTLPQLYGRALLGDAFDESSKRADCLMISVSPGWIDSKDIMGFVNSMERMFHPSESRLYLELLEAEYEHGVKLGATPIRMICLDEMNLAQPEHYFGDMLAVLEREGVQRRVRVFSDEACGPKCQFRLNGSIKLSSAIRFVGTVNFDETTRLLSDRLLDRANLIELQSSNLPSLGGWDPHARAQGAPVTLSDFEEWKSVDALPGQLASILDQLRPCLTAIGCGISPRTYRGLCAFVASSKGLMDQGEAFDLQLVQRVLSRLRNAHTKAQLDALDELARIIEGSADSKFEETLRKVATKRSEALDHDWESEGGQR